ncbi:hypothetical protein ACV2G4_02890 [Salmonella enterica subsp. enterica serovar Oranienburg]
MKRLTMVCFALSLLFASSASADYDCQITFSSPVVNFGWLKQDDVVDSHQGWHQMPSREVNMNVFCPTPQTIALFIQANAGEKGRFHFGNNSGLAVRVSQMIVDGKSYSIAKTLDRTHFAADGDPQESLLLHNNYGIAAMDNHQPVSGRQMSVVVTLTPVLNEQQFNHMSDVTTLESDLQWEVLTH